MKELLGLMQRTETLSELVRQVEAGRYSARDTCARALAVFSF